MFFMKVTWALHINNIFMVKTGLLWRSLNFLGYFKFSLWKYFCWLRPKKFSDVVKHLLLKNMDMHNVNLLNISFLTSYVDVICYLYCKHLETAKLTILQQLEFRFFLRPSPWTDQASIHRKVSWYFPKTKITPMISSNMNKNEHIFILFYFLFASWTLNMKTEPQTFQMLHLPVSTWFYCKDRIGQKLENNNCGKFT